MLQQTLKLFALDLGSVGNPTIPSAVSGTEPTVKIESMISAILGTITIVASVALLIMFAMGGIEYITAGGDEKQTASAKRTTTSAVLGLIVVVASMTIATIVLKIFGIDIKALPWYGV
ncbi:hypothetical protein COT49_01655 [candidate division WWE3 bacterium CG08_land_8_20_14_0_20_40_13]|uniref:Uncharacterized protein n=1 Tax=candidate division WWE3 bacterium CG08_land_8_20_14_0_20_40_13 TaxID=1975084 RepID=A0A2H0XDY3_UNCKA|nr:MAG: hypothetical protein COT49_01655 [candidate division WWE3 bacterium CG08_land_8_20_14_0_20_40_13]